MDTTHESAARSVGRDDIPGRALARERAGLAVAPEQLATALSRSDAGSREDVIARLQAAGGNLEVGRLLQPGPGSGGGRTETMTVRHAFQATIPKAPSSRSDKPPEAGGDAHEQEAMIEKAAAPQAAGGASAAPAAAGGGAAAGPAPAQVETPGGSAGGSETPAPAGSSSSPGPTEQPAGGGAEAPGAGQKTSIPDIHLPALAEIERCDGVVGVLGYSGSITRGGAQPSGFGVTRSFSSSLTNITVTTTPSAWVVTATLEHPITYQIRSATGPDGQTNVGSDTDSAITAANYGSVVSDLTPDMNDLNGRPPRTSYWSEDLTVKHELVHANDDKGNGPLAMVQVMGWLNTQTASDIFDLVNVFKQVPTRFAANLLAALSTEDGEKHAYGDGAPSYKARADSISAKGAKGDYH